MPESAIRIAVLVLMVLALPFNILARRSGTAGVDERTGGSILRYGWGYRGFGVVIAALFLLLPLARLSGPPVSTLTLFMVFSPFSALGLGMMNNGRARVILADEGIEAFSPWRGRAALAWADVADVRFGHLVQWFVIRGESGTVIRIGRSMAGAAVFPDYCQRHLPPDRFEAAVRAYDAAVRRSA